MHDDLAAWTPQNPPQARVKIQLARGEVEAGGLRLPGISFLLEFQSGRHKSLHMIAISDFLRYGERASQSIWLARWLGKRQGCSRGTCIYSMRTTVYTQRVYMEQRMPVTGTKARNQARNHRDETINLRASQRQKALIDRAADALGRNRSDFMLETACREAEAVLLDRRYFALSSEEFKRFTSMLDRPPAGNARLRRLLKSKAPWEQ